MCEGRSALDWTVVRGKTPLSLSELLLEFDGGSMLLSIFQLFEEELLRRSGPRSRVTSRRNGQCQKKAKIEYGLPAKKGSSLL